MATMASLKEKFLENANKLINHQGYMIIGNNYKQELPVTFDWQGQKMTAREEATIEDAQRDCDFLGCNFSNPRKYYYKCITD